VNRHLAGVLALCICIPGAGLKLMDFRAGTARVGIGGDGRFNVLRDVNPLLFWALTLLNAAVIAVILVAGAAMAVLP
jgi:hypothetical protein